MLVAVQVEQLLRKKVHVSIFKIFPYIKWYTKTMIFLICRIVSIILKIASVDRVVNVFYYKNKIKSGFCQA